MNNSGCQDGCTASQRPSGETLLNPLAVRFQTYGCSPRSSSPIIYEPNEPVKISTSFISDSEVNPGGTATSSCSSLGGEWVSVPGEMRQREYSPGRCTNNSPLGEKLTRMLSPTLAFVIAPGALPVRSQTPQRSAPQAASHRPSGANAADRNRGPSSSLNSR